VSVRDRADGKVDRNGRLAEDFWVTGNDNLNVAQMRMVSVFYVKSEEPCKANLTIIIDVRVE
jgi:hypothetical protein